MDEISGERPVVRQTLSGWSHSDAARISFELSHVELGPERPPEHAPFVVDETPHVVWDHALREKNLSFLQGIDTGYFRHVAEVHHPLLSSNVREARQRSATALRFAHAHALETFCALAAASVQAPHFALGWLLRYKNQDLESVIRKLQMGEPMHSAWPDRFSWLRLSELVHEVPATIPEKDLHHVKEAFARAWSLFAADFVDRANLDEYNSLKHGLRARSGGFKISMGPVDQSGQLNPETMTTPSGSVYGCSYFLPERIGNRRDWAVSEQHQNWVPENLAGALVLLSMSINNLVWFLRRQAGDSAAAQLHRPSSNAIFDDPWAVRLEFDRMVTHPMVGESAVASWTNTEILSLFPMK